MCYEKPAFDVSASNSGFFIGKNKMITEKQWKSAIEEFEGQAYRVLEATLH